MYFWGRRVKRKVEEYEYDEALEPAYRDSMFKLFQKTLSEGYFNMIIVDAVNNKASSSYIPDSLDLSIGMATFW